MIGLCSLAVDWGRVQIVRGELRLSADAAARYGASGLPDGAAVVRARAKDAADDNTANNTPVVLADADIELGNWAKPTKTFTPNLSPLNAVRVTARRTGANAVPLVFARALGKTSSNVQASAVVSYRADPMTMGFIGLNSISFQNNSFIGSYRSGVIKQPAEGYSTGKAVIGSNGLIESKNNGVLAGGLVLGPGASVISTPAQGTTTHLDAPIPVPDDPAWNPSGNPGGVSQSYSTSSPATLPGGTYWFTSLTLGGDLNFNGPATVYVNGNVTINGGDITAYQQVPSNLRIYQLGNDRTFTANNNFSMVGQVSAPRTDFVAKNNITFYGTALFRTIDTKNNADIFLDEQAMSGIAGGGSSGILTLVK
jgi:hypothetical protein